MEKNYLQYVPEARQWDIIQQVISLHGYGGDNIVEMVKDGYMVTVELLEMLYRLRAFDVIEAIVPYDNTLYSNDFVNSSKMLVLKKALGAEKAFQVRQRAINAQKSAVEQKKREENECLEARLNELHEHLGLSSAFFESIVSSDKLMRMALDKYDKDTVISELAKTKMSKSFLIREVSSLDLAKNGLYDIATSKLIFYSDYDRKVLLSEILKTDEGFEYLVENYNQITEAKNILPRIIAKDSNLRERAKTLGHKGYEILFASETMTVKEFEIWCSIEPSAVKYYKLFKKSIIWVIRKGFLKYL